MSVTQNGSAKIQQGTLHVTLEQAYTLSQDLSETLERLDTLVQSGEYEAAYDAFNEAFVMPEKITHLITDDIAHALEEIAPAEKYGYGREKRRQPRRDIYDTIGHIGVSLEVLGNAIQFRRPKKQGNELDDAQLSDLVRFVNDLRRKCYEAEDGVRGGRVDPEVPAYLEEIRQHLTLLETAFDFNYDADASIVCEGLRKMAESARVRAVAVLDERSEVQS